MSCLVTGQTGVYNESSGLKIAYLGGLDASNKSSAKDTICEFNHEEIRNLRIQLESEKGEFKGVDILITSQWPQGVHRLSQNKLVS